MRQKLMNAILEKYRGVGQVHQEAILTEALRSIQSDATLISLASDLGIDTDTLLFKEGDK